MSKLGVEIDIGPRIRSVEFWSDSTPRQITITASSYRFLSTDVAMSLKVIDSVLTSTSTVSYVDEIKVVIGCITFTDPYPNYTWHVLSKFPPFTVTFVASECRK